MRIGIVCPYSFDAHGGVQVHVMDLAGELFRRGHEVQVLAPASQDTELPDWGTSAGDSIAIPYNGSVARLNFGALVARRARRWLDAGDFDILHIHEPITPSVGMLALQAATGPVVGTFHAAMDRSLARELLSPATVPLMEKLSARIAVSEEARRTLIQYHGGDAVVIPNGVYVAPFAAAGIPIIGVEPSCTAVLRDDLRDLLPEDPRSALVSRATHTLAEALSAVPDSARRLPDLSGVTIVAQPHCHHYSVMGWDTDQALLESLGARVLRLEGCCGLAGNFGMEAGHYDLSLAVASHSLLPTLEAQRDAVYLADGFSCRTQASQLAGRAGVHLATLLAEGGVRSGALSAEH